MTLESVTLKNAHYLKELMYQALFVAPGSDPFPLSILEQPSISRYFEQWGRSGDFGQLIWNQGELAGGAWCRTFTANHPGYGFYNEATPELIVAVNPQFRNQGIGTELIQHLSALLIQNGVTHLSLNVQKRNPALKLYQRLGFRLHSEDQDTCTMVSNLVT